MHASPTPEILTFFSPHSTKLKSNYRDGLAKINVTETWFIALQLGKLGRSNQYNHHHKGIQFTVEAITCLPLHHIISK